ncbi:MAG TPA: hypothetical protein VN421_09565 [Pseudoflavonifractor sp.]|nr:hypothetical protein [Pseudoflavonifractor sp.]
MSTSPCETCEYHGVLSNAIICDYIGIVGHMRGCPKGEGCTVRVGRDEPDTYGRMNAYGRKVRIWDTAKAEAMKAEGKSLKAIAEAVGRSVGAVQFYFRQQDKK